MQTQTWDITVVYDDLAFPGSQWWARCDTDGPNGDFLGFSTALCADPVDALLEMARRLGWGITTTDGEPAEAS